MLMDTLPVNEFRRQVGEYLNQTYYAGKAFTLMKGNRPMAALIPIAMLDRLNELEAMFQLTLTDSAGPLESTEQSANESAGLS